jgi:hypothetical protein
MGLSRIADFNSEAPAPSLLAVRVGSPSAPLQVRYGLFRPKDGSRAGSYWSSDGSRGGVMIDLFSFSAVLERNGAKLR